MEVKVVNRSENPEVKRITKPLHNIKLALHLKCFEKISLKEKGSLIMTMTANGSLNVSISIVLEFFCVRCRRTNICNGRNSSL